MSPWRTHWRQWSSLEEDAARLLRDLARSIEFSAGALWAPDDDVLVAHAYWHSEAAEAEAFEAEMRQRRFAPGTGLPGECGRARAPINACPHPRGSCLPAARGRRGRAGLRGAVAFPAIADDEVLAVVELLSRDEAPLPKRLMRSLTWIGYEIGQFLATRRGELLPPSLTPRELEVLQLAARGQVRAADRKGAVCEPDHDQDPLREHLLEARGSRSPFRGRRGAAPRDHRVARAGSYLISPIRMACATAPARSLTPSLS